MEREFHTVVRTGDDVVYSHLYNVWGMESCDPNNKIMYNRISVRQKVPRNETVLQLIRDCLYNFYGRNPNHYCADSFHYFQAVINHHYQFGQSTKDPMHMALYESKAKYDQETSDGLGIRLTGKPGKLIKKAFPYLDELACTQFAEAWKEAFAPVNLVVKEGSDKEAFRHMYQDDQTKCLNPYYGRKDNLESKSLSGSCMRGDNFPAPQDHPAEVYASGYFKAIWAEGQEGKIAARCVVCIKRHFRGIDLNCFVPGPIYTNSDQAFELIKQELIKQGFDEGADESWIGAKLLAIETDDGWLMPYVDMDSSLDLDSNETVFTIVRSGDYDANTTRGYVEKDGKDTVCDCCGDRFNSEYECYAYLEPTGETYCESCTNNELFYCDHLGETVKKDEVSKVYHTTRYGTEYNYVSDEYLQSRNNDKFVYSEADSEWWEMDDVTYCESVSDYIPESLIGATKDFNYSTSGELYETSDLIELPNGDLVSISNELESSIWTIKEGVLTLLPGYQLDANNEPKPTEEELPF